VNFLGAAAIGALGTILYIARLGMDDKLHLPSARG
jgi:hypothetical protein